MYIGETFRISKCFSEFDVPKSIEQSAYRRQIADAVAGHKLTCYAISGSGMSAWFSVRVYVRGLESQKFAVVVHRKFLTSEATEIVIESRYRWAYQNTSVSGALADAVLKYPTALHRVVAKWEQ